MGSISYRLPTDYQYATDRLAAKHTDMAKFLERETRLELATSTLARLRSTN